MCCSEEEERKWLLAKLFDPNTIKLGSHYATGCKVKVLIASY
jgi:hypothetical protein